MCLQVDKDYPKKKDGTIRYKVLISYNGRFVSPVQETFWTLGEWKEKQPELHTNIDAKGFHVHVSLRQATTWRNSSECIVRCECKNFVAGGNGEEIWGSVKLLSVIRIPCRPEQKKLYKKYLRSKKK